MEISNRFVYIVVLHYIHSITSQHYRYAICCLSLHVNLWIRCEYDDAFGSQITSHLIRRALSIWHKIALLCAHFFPRNDLHDNTMDADKIRARSASAKKKSHNLLAIYPNQQCVRVRNRKHVDLGSSRLICARKSEISAIHAKSDVNIWLVPWPSHWMAFT